MSAKDKFHDAVKNALVKDGWTITADPLQIPLGEINAYIDLGADRILSAEKSGEKIAVENQKFSRRVKHLRKNVVSGSTELHRRFLFEE
jgi:hypothetical protein